jgi:hypothetical protein
MKLKLHGSSAKEINAKLKELPRVLNGRIVTIELSGRK